MRELPPQVERGILKRLLEGATYREAAQEFGVSTATVHRVAEDTRKRMPDFDSLRDLSILLRKAGVNVFDAMRACSLMEALNKWGISLEELDGYVRLNQKFLSDRTLDENFLFYALKLMRMEEASGQTYQEVVENYEKKKREAAEAEERKLASEKETVRLKVELKETTGKLAEVRADLEKIVMVRKGLADIGLSKLAQLVRFIKDFEALGFDADQMKRLALWHRRLQELHINPDELDKYIAENGPLESQNNRLRLANERLKADVNANAVRREKLLAENSVLQAVDLTLRTGILNMQCKSCGRLLPIWLPSKESLRNLMDTGQVFTLGCQNCGMLQSFTPWDIVFQIAWMILPTGTVTIDLNFSED